MIFFSVFDFLILFWRILRFCLIPYLLPLVGTTLLSSGPALTRDIIFHTPLQPAISECLIPLMIFLIFKGKIGKFSEAVVHGLVFIYIVL